MSAQLSRLQAFLAGAGELEVVTPAPAIRPDYFSRFAKLMGATVVATHVATATAAAPVQAPGGAAAAPTASVPAAAHDHATTQASIRSVKDIAARYLSHGRTPLKPVITMMNPDDDHEVGPTATAMPGDICEVAGVRADYGKAEPRLAVMAGTPEQRAQVLVHESMHCRLGPALLRYVARDTSVAEFAVTFSESSADAMTILTVARKDGVPAALSALDHWYKVRGDEAASPDSDGLHDSRETLSRIRELLTKTPEKVDSDGAAFALAITEGLAGASRTYANALPADRKDVREAYIASPEFKAQMAGFHQAVEEMARGYLEGPYDMGALKVSLNNEVVEPNSPVASGTWQLLARKLGAQPFTAAGLRGQVEAITASFIASAAGAAPAKLASAGLPAAQASTAMAIGRLRSHLSAIYVDPVPVGAGMLDDVDQRANPETERAAF